MAFGRAGAFTDDTQMTLFTAEGLVEAWRRRRGGRIERAVPLVHDAYLRWLWTQGAGARPGRANRARAEQPRGGLVEHPGLRERRAPGMTCLSALAGATRLGDFADNDSKGCGTVMRVAPAGVVRPALAGDADRAAFNLGVDVSRLTHGHPSGYLAGGFFALLIACLCDGLPLLDAIAKASAPLEGSRACGSP